MESKKQFRWFTIFEYEKEQDYLREMHKSGWKFVKVKGLGMYYFEKCDPQDVVYQLDYNKDGLAHKDEYLRMFDDCGWEYIQDYAGYSYFRKAVSEDGVADESIYLARPWRDYGLAVFENCTYGQHIAIRYEMEKLMIGNPCSRLNANCRMDRASLAASICSRTTSMTKPPQ